MGNGKRNGKIHGAKFCKHTTVTEPARKVAEVLNKFPEVTKISNGSISGKGSSQFSMKFLQIHGGWTIQVCGCHAMQKLHVYTKDPNETMKKIKSAFQKNAF